jgi:hypothetical protein
MQLMEWKINEDLKSRKKVASILEAGKSGGSSTETSHFTTAKMKTLK